MSTRQAMQSVASLATGWIVWCWVILWCGNSFLMSVPKYSIITVCLNAKDGLKRTLHSIEQQIFDNFEWIIVDGGSTDGTVDIVRDHPCVNHLISEPDEGIYDAMNKGIKISSGEYLLFLNAGDWLYNKKTLSDVEEHLKTDIVTGNLAVIDNSGVISLRKYDACKIDKKYLYNKTLPHQSTFIKKNLFYEYGLYCNEFKIKGDHDFFARVFSREISFSFSSVCIAFFCLDGLSFRMKKSRLFNHELVLVRKRNFKPLYRGYRGAKEIVWLINNFLKG